MEPSTCYHCSHVLRPEVPSFSFARKCFPGFCNILNKMALTGCVVLGQAKARAEGSGSESWDILELPGWRRWALLTVLPRSPAGLIVGD